MQALQSWSVSQKGEKSQMAERKQFSCIILWKISMTIAAYRPNTVDSHWQLCKCGCDMWVFTQHDATRGGIHQHLAAPLLQLLLALALFTHPHILGHFHTPPPPSSSLPSPPPPPCLHLPLLLLLPASSLSCSRCGVAIATEKCGNTSVLQSAGGRGKEREREIRAGREEEGEDGRQTESEGVDRRRDKSRGDEGSEGSVEKTVN